jgi:hypothetical protein
VITRDRVREGMTVRGADGRKLGQVLACEEERFVFEHGFFFPTDYVARYEDVSGITRKGIRLWRAPEELARVERADPREGGLGESVTVGIAGGLEAPLGERLARADEVDDGRRRADAEDGAGRAAGEEPGALPASYGDEGGGGLL